MLSPRYLSTSPSSFQKEFGFVQLSMVSTVGP